jgi:tetratricopeptide (TPR) repeat protein
MRSARFTITGLIIACLAPLAMSGCATKQTPLVVLEEKADHEFDYQRWQKASEYYGEIAQRDPSNEQAQFRYGLSLMRIGEYSKAEAPLLTAQALDPGNDEIVFALAEVMHQCGQHAKLFAMLRNRAHDNRSVATWMVLVDYSEKLDDYDSALEAVRNACAIDTGTDAEPYYRAAVLLGRINQNDEAVRRLRQAYAIDPEHEQVNTLLLEYGEIPGPTLGLAPGR